MEKCQQVQSQFCADDSKMEILEQKKKGPLGKDFYVRDALTVAYDLIGKEIVRKTVKGVIRARIVETEAYRAPQDKASHAYNMKKTERTRAM